MGPSHVSGLTKHEAYIISSNTTLDTELWRSISLATVLSEMARQAQPKAHLNSKTYTFKLT